MLRLAHLVKEIIYLTIHYRHMFFTMEDREDEIEINVDRFSDSYARDTNVDELKDVCCSTIKLHSWATIR